MCEKETRQLLMLVLLLPCIFIGLFNAASTTDYYSMEHLKSQKGKNEYIVIYSIISNRSYSRKFLAKSNI